MQTETLIDDTSKPCPRVGKTMVVDSRAICAPLRGIPEYRCNTGLNRQLKKLRSVETV